MARRIATPFVAPGAVFSVFRCRGSVVARLGCRTKNANLSNAIARAFGGFGHLSCIYLRPKCYIITYILRGKRMDDGFRHDRKCRRLPKAPAPSPSRRRIPPRQRITRADFVRHCRNCRNCRTGSSLAPTVLGIAETAESPAPARRPPLGLAPGRAVYIPTPGHMYTCTVEHLFI